MDRRKARERPDGDRSNLWSGFGVSRPGVIPGPTVRVRMGEMQPACVDGRGAHARLVPALHAPFVGDLPLSRDRSRHGPLP